MTKRAENTQPEDDSHPYLATPPEGFVSSSRPVDPNDIPSFTEVPELADDFGKKIKEAKVPDTLKPSNEDPLMQEYKKLKSILETNGFKLTEQRGETEEEDENGTFIHKTYTTLERKKGFRKPKGKVTIISTSSTDDKLNHTPISNEILVEQKDPRKYHEFYMDLYWKIYEAGLKIGKHNNGIVSSVRNTRLIESEIDPTTRKLIEIAKTLKSVGFNAEEASPGNWTFLRERKLGKTADFISTIYNEDSQKIEIYINTQSPDEEQKLRQKIKTLLEKKGHTLYDHTREDRFDYHYSIDLDKTA